MRSGIFLGWPVSAGCLLLLFSLLFVVLKSLSWHRGVATAVTVSISVSLAGLVFVGERSQSACEANIGMYIL